jgi:hypothetical protein
MTAGVPIGEAFPWPDSGGAVQMLTPTQLVELGGVMLAATLPLYQKSWALNAALVQLRTDFRNATDPQVKWEIYGKLREIEQRVKAIKARNSNGTQVPDIADVIKKEKDKNK